MKKILNFLIFIIVCGALTYWIGFGAFETIPRLAQTVNNNTLGKYQYIDDISKVRIESIYSSLDRSVKRTIQYYDYNENNWIENTSKKHTTYLVKVGSNENDFRTKVVVDNETYYYKVQNNEIYMKTTGEYVECKEYDITDNPLIDNFKYLDCFDKDGNIYGASLLFEDSAYVSSRRQFTTFITNAKDGEEEIKSIVKLNKLIQLVYTSYTYKNNVVTAKEVISFDFDYNVSIDD